ncbi:VanZ family protein [Saccharomonospora azurea]|uniref:VanZ family protein n=1 Tax=Saccharomonospora azurea TaxID=40988 RepID=UPI003D8F23B0
MTTAQETALAYGLGAFVVAWSMLAIPQLITHLARFGRVDRRRVLTTGVVTLYACLAVAVVVLPLPGPGDQRLAQTVQLVPFQWVTDVGTELATYGLPRSHALLTLTFQQLAMNVLLFVPLGALCVLLWRRGFLFTTLAGFGVSLLVEITQLTANFGTAPFVYRIFDVDDLMANTAGAVLGWVAATVALLLVRLRKADAARASAAVRPTPLAAAVPPHRAAPDARAVAGPVGAPHADLRTQPLPLPR